MIPEAALLACARIGAIHSVVFGGFSPDSLAGRIADCKSKLVITADEGLRGGKKIKLKHNTDEALTKSLGDEKVIVIRRTGAHAPIASPDQIQFAPGLPRRVQAKSCGESCARSRRLTFPISATLRPWLIQPWSTTSLITGKTRRARDGFSQG
jgi:AMP-binding enzyme